MLKMAIYMALFFMFFVPIATSWIINQDKFLRQQQAQDKLLGQQQARACSVQADRSWVIRIPPHGSSSVCADYIAINKWGYHRVIFTELGGAGKPDHIRIEGANGARVLLYPNTIVVEAQGNLPPEALDWKLWSTQRFGEVYNGHAAK